MQAVLVIGGMEGTTYSKAVERYLINENTWDRLANLNIGRGGHSSCLHNDHIYVFGGTKPSCRPSDLLINSFEKLNLADLR